HSEELALIAHADRELHDSLAIALHLQGRLEGVLRRNLSRGGNDRLESPASRENEYWLRGDGVDQIEAEGMKSEAVPGSSERNMDAEVVRYDRLNRGRKVTHHCLPYDRVGCAATDEEDRVELIR